MTALALAGCSAPPIDTGNPQAEVSSMLDSSARAWTRGDLAGFMASYAHDSTTSWVSGGHVQYGWQKLYDRYQTAYFAPGKQHDSLTFDELAVHPLNIGLAYTTGRFALHRGDSLVASGIFTLILQRRDGRWVILHDHTSADAKP